VSSEAPRPPGAAPGAFRGGPGCAGGPGRAERRRLGDRLQHASHWGAFLVAEAADGLVVSPHPDDPQPSALLANVADTAHHRSRVRAPSVRRSWWEDGPGPRRRHVGDEWIEVGWEQVLDRVAAEWRRVRDVHGPQAVYAGSYGWASAGRLHHAQSQLRRFVELAGGATVSVGTYSTGAAEVLLPHVVGPAELVWAGATSWKVVAAHTDTLVAFGGLPAKNTAVAPGGVLRHGVAGWLARARERGMVIESFSPIRDDTAAELGARWHPLVPGTDTAVMLGLAHELLSSGCADLAWCERYCVGTERLVDYVLGHSDGVPKSPAWAARLAGLDPSALVELAGRMAAGRTLVSTSWSLQRAHHGEQPLWMSIALAALLGQIGLPGGGFGNGYSSLADVGAGVQPVPAPRLPGALRRLDSWIPVARVADMLLDPGGIYDFDGRERRYPDVRLVYWVGGNPFHHHQDLGRLARAFSRPDTVVVHEAYWTATARHADVVLPATITLERNDFALGRADAKVLAMRRVLAPYGQARNDQEIFAGLAARLGLGDAFGAGKDERAWLEDLWERLASRLGAFGTSAPSFEQFWADGEALLPALDEDRVLLAAFRADPLAHPLATPSGRLELWSETIAGFGYDDCPPQPRWLPPDEWLGSPLAEEFPLHLIANNPASRLHSQLDPGATSRASKVAGREPLRMHPADAAARNLTPGQVVRVHNRRGACLAGLVVTNDLRPGVVQLSTGAWYDPADPSERPPLCRHGNPNVLTADVATSRLSQACSGAHTLVEVVGYEGEPPPVRAWDPPGGLDAPGWS